MRNYITEEEFQRDLQLAHLHCNESYNWQGGMLPIIFTF